LLAKYVLVPENRSVCRNRWRKLQFFRKKVTHRCVRCDKELIHKYKAQAEWNIQGFLCSTCHIEITKEFITRQQEEKSKKELSLHMCAVCKKELILESDRYRPRWQWNLERGTTLCKGCYEIKSTDYERKLNYCVICESRLGFVRYNPKPKWNIQGQLCRNCWDRENHERH
jgi:hypothetical protein